MNILNKSIPDRGSSKCKGCGGCGSRNMWMVFDELWEKLVCLELRGILGKVGDMIKEVAGNRSVRKMLYFIVKIYVINS